MKKCVAISMLIDAAGPLAFAEALWPQSEWPYRRANDARARGAIPLALWPAAIRLAEKHGLALDHETLTAWQINARRRHWRRLKSA